ncbi:gamma-glutamyl-gamma-aminobutyraldehyde dehydrogenase/4-guanidinobutyraldehyde dehydrogenase/NAD-dependent aldehyde dehydrogenase [Pseudoduganella flava]|uniref:Aldehyde dehydrogenase family protein n=1 Tax=Pseudoduganella flava TaxID=871742 RepID=A0A562PWP1_9BURK|nr:aldehyde dehydrogenase [Pseudoduganella flava]QGZ39894.1 aldehyde dehydrogenase family protein [Pseudoduganella flava]TWI48827.1 gamma-glutamyl-gamma-aminobutyraldehyde dehydrogenase/4-guanidinobutyraldehyde dehydrogenase/NAD-dependent aldehyde dehydrogenase [Pseudoduganella flava]
MTDTTWHDRARNLNIDGRAFIDGQRTWSRSGQQFDNLSPIDGRNLGPVARCGADDVELAVANARAAFEDGRWANLAPAKRKRVLVKFADLMQRHRDELALLETLDMGKPIKYSLSVDLGGAANCIRWYGEAIDKVYGEIAPAPSDSLALITREPVGVVAAIVPWNYPMLMASWKIAPALAAGNSVVLKPSEKSPLTALRLAELALEAGIPPGVFNVLPGFGNEAGSALALHMDVDCIAFTGSTRVGKQILQMAGQSNLKRAWTELGGKSANIVCADCPDLDAAVAASIGSIFFNQGESCNAPSRLFVEESIRERFIEKALALVPDFTPGDPLDENTVMGAIVDDIQLGTIMKYIGEGKAAGARLLAGGERMRLESGGYYVAPTIFDNVHADMSIAREEIFGPVLSVLGFTSLDDAVKQANATQYGLHAAVWTSDLSKAIRTSRALRAGTVHVNQYDNDDITVPFGGYKQSGNGRDKSLHAFDKYTELKTTWIQVARA